MRLDGEMDTPVQGKPGAAIDQTQALPNLADLVSDPVVVARDACGRRRTPSDRTYEYVSFEAWAGKVLVLAASEARPVAELLRAVAGLAAPVSGSLCVDGTELARRGRAGGLRRAGRLARGTVGLGVVTGLAEPGGTLTVEESVVHEFGLWRRADSADAEAGSWDGSDVLGYLARFELATDVDRQLADLPAPARARLSAALAFVCRPRAAAVDLTDAFMAHLSAADGAVFVQLLADLARETGAAVLVGTTDVALAAAADAAVSLDMTTAEALAAAPSDAAPASVSHSLPYQEDDAL